MPKKIIEEKMDFAMPTPAPTPKKSVIKSFFGLIKNLLGKFFALKRSTQIMSVILLIAIGAALFFWFQINQLKKDPASVAQKQTQELVARVGKLIVLPENETPTMATVSDPSKLQDQPFFLNAKKGFNVLIYSSAKKAILYDPFSNKIVEVAPISIGGSGPQTLDEKAVPSSPTKTEEVAPAPKSSKK